MYIAKKCTYALTYYNNKDMMAAQKRKLPKHDNTTRLLTTKRRRRVCKCNFDTDDNNDKLCERCERHLHKYTDDTNKYYYKKIGGEMEKYLKHNNIDHNHIKCRQMIHFFNDKDMIAHNDDEYKDLRLRTPFCCLLAGKSQCGKTQLMIKILEQWRHITDDHDGKYTKRIYWFYGTRNDRQLANVKDIYDKFRREIPSSSSESTTNESLQFIDGSASNKIKMKDVILKAENAILVLDDLMNEISKDDDLLSLFTRESHHKRLCIFYM